MTNGKIKSGGKYRSMHFPKIASLFGIIIGALVLTGWILNIPFLKSIHPEYVSMKINAALAFILTGISLRLLIAERNERNNFIIYLLMSIVFLIGLFTLAEYALNLESQIDLIFFEQTDKVGTSHPGRMAPNTAVCFIFISIGFITGSYQKSGFFQYAQYFIIATLLISWAAFIGYLYGIEESYGMLDYTKMAIHTSVTFLFLSVGLLLARPEFWLVSLFAGDTYNDIIIRRLFFTAIILPTVLGWFRWKGELNNHFSNTVGMILMVVTTTIMLAITLIWSAVSMQRVEKKRRQAEEELKQHRDNLDKLVDERTAQLNIAYKTLKDSEERYRTTLDSMLEGCQIIGFDWRYIYINDAADKHNRRPKQELLGIRYMDAWPAIESTYVFQVIKDCMERKTASHMENEFVFPDGSKGWFELSIQPVPEGTFILSYDISERKHAEQELHELNTELEKRVEIRTMQLEEANKELEAFSYSVSHDLRAPLRHISGFIQLLKTKSANKLDENSLRYLNIITESANQMGQLIDDLLNLSRVSRAEINITAVNPNLIVKEVLTELNSTSSDSKITWSISNLPEVKADYNLLKVVLMNLISNAIKYSSKNEKPVIEINSYKSQNEIIFSVKDNGAGFDENYVHKLFGVFQRLHSDSEFEGNGIGLATVKRIIIKHGGSVWAEGKINCGAAFFFSLPLNN